MNRRPFNGCVVFVTVIVLGMLCSNTVQAAKTLPPDVSEIIRQLGELRDICWGLVSEARMAYSNNTPALTELNKRYIEASAAANSVIEQLDLELAAHTTLDPKRYQPTVNRTAERCQALTNEWYRLMTALPKTRGGTTNAASRSTSTTTSSKTSSTVSVETPSLGGNLDAAAKAVGIADGLLSLFTKHSKAMGSLDAEQRADVRNLLVQKKWKPLNGSAVSAPEPAGRNSPASTNKPPAAKSASPFE